MVSFSWKSIVLKWNVFFMWGSINCFDEYLPIYMKQLGLTPSQIGITSVFGIISFSAILTGFLADKYRARKIMLVIGSLLLVLLSLAPLLPLIVKNLQIAGEPERTIEIVSNTSNMSSNKYDKGLNLSLATNKTENIINNDTFLSNSSPLFLLFFIIKVLCDIIKIPILSLNNIAILTYNKNEKANYGSYICWGQVGSALSLFGIGMLASHTEITISGKIARGYFVTFPVAAMAIGLSLIAVPWMDYEYLKNRVIKWAEVKAVIFDIHYIVVLFIGFYCGWCYSFQMYWEFWYIDYLSGGPSLMALSGIIRRPFVALLCIISVKVIQKLGDLHSMALALLMFGIAQLAMSFIQIPWLVLVINILQSLGFVLSYSTLQIHLAKAGTKASKAVIVGKKNVVIYNNFYIFQ